MEFLGVVCGLFFRFDFGFAFAVGGFGFLEDGDDVLALWEVGTSVNLVSRKVSYQTGRLTLLTTFPLLLMTVIVSPTPIADVGCWACSCTARC